MEDSPHWFICIDTGGTFTDCLAKDPDGKLHHLKVLSSSALRGRVISARSSPSEVNSNEPEISSIQIEHSWPVDTDIFHGYYFRLLGEHQRYYRVLSYIPQYKLLSLEGKIVLPKGNVDFEITSFEEAPVLAARLLTSTALDDPLPPIEMRLGTTKGTNALLERKGAKVALITTKGFADLLHIGNQQRPELFSLAIEKPPTLFHQCWEIDERISANGEIIRPLNSSEITRMVEEVGASDCEAIAIALLHAYRNPVHEQTLVRKFEKAGFRYNSTSSDLSPSVKLLPRMETAVVNAYLARSLENYVGSITKKLGHGKLYIMTSTGSLARDRFFHPKDSLLSGPAGGLVGAVTAAEECEIDRLITLDMGGTSTDVARYQDRYDYQYQIEVGEVSLSSPGMAIETVAAGGGSICGFDGHKLFVGPESAGAYPGPACYGAGGPLTLTDVNLLLGRIAAEDLDIPIHKEASEAAIQKIQLQSGKDKADLLKGFLQIAHEKMAGAIQRISTRKGFDPKEYVLVAFGGAGGQHACAVAEALGMKQVLIPAEAGILSARGIGQASMERFVMRQILRPLEEVSKNWMDIFEELIDEGEQILKQEGLQGPFLSEGRIYMRLLGQDYSLELPFPFEGDAKEVFKSNYLMLFGHWIEDRTIEVESLKVFVTATQSYEVYKNTDIKEKVSLFYRTDTIQRVQRSGPQKISARHHTIFVEEGWTYDLHSSGHLLLTYKQELERPTKHSELSPEAYDSNLIDIAQLELFTNRFLQVVEEMGAQLERTAFSVNVKERMDFSCALLDAEGKLVVNAPHIPVHLGSMGMCVRSAIRKIAPEKDSVIITNHPAYGGSHLPDVTLIHPVYADEGDLLGFVANRAHHAEIGGTFPGSMPPDATSLEEEGVVIVPQYLMRKGNVDWNRIKALFSTSPYPSRAINENIADLNAGLASLTSGALALQQLSRNYGTAVVKQFMSKLGRYAHLQTQRAMTSFIGTTYSATEYLDDGSPINVSIKFQQKTIDVDFSGSAPVHPGNLNATPAIIHSVVMYVLRLLIDEDIPLNEGILQDVHIRLPQGMLSPRFDGVSGYGPAVVGGNTEISQRTTDTLLKALKLNACSQGTMNNVLFGNNEFGYYETIGGGTGAGNGFHGADAIHHHMTNTRMTDPEIQELRYPVRIMNIGIRHGSGGNGKWVGGNGMHREILFLAPLALSLISQHRIQAPYGMKGGEAGKVGEQFLIKADGTKQLLKGIDSCEVNSGDRLVMLTPGGGGYGLVNEQGR